MSDSIKEKRLEIASLVEMSKPEKVFDEVSVIMKDLMSSDDMKRLHALFVDVVSLYRGDYPGYNACNTEYHDLRHTTDVFLCLARLVHGGRKEGAGLDGRIIFLGLAAAMMHDTGYIQAEDDKEGTGAKYTKEHVSRSVEFMSAYFKKNGYSNEDIECSGQLIRATSIDLKLSDIKFADAGNRRMGGLLFAADMIGQMSDRVYLEKLLFLFRELSEANFMGFDSEIDLLDKTIGFYTFIRRKLGLEVEHHDRYLRSHFKERFNVDRNLYHESIEKNMAYLSLILKESKDAYRSKLNREGMVKKLENMERNKSALFMH